MKICGSARRVFLSASALFLLAFIPACSTRAPQSMDVPGVEPADSMAQNDSDQAFEDSSYLATETPTERTAQAITVIPSGADGFGVKYTETRGATNIQIAEATPTEWKIETLQSPNRVVVDLFDGGDRANKNIAIDGSTTVSQLRVGAHPDKTRLVFDLTQAPTGTPVITRSETGLTLTIPTANDYAADLTPPADTKPFESALNTIPAIEPEMPASVTQPHGPSLQAIQFSEKEGPKALVANLSSVGAFTLRRTAPSEYVLTLEGTNFDPQFISTLIAPSGSNAIRSVRPVASDGNTLLRIFVQPEVDLSARTQGNTIVVESSSYLANANARAQAEVDAAPVEDDSAAEAAGDVTIEGSPADAAVDADVTALLDEQPKYTGRLISLDLQDTDIDNALRIIAEVSNLNIIASDDVTGKVTLRLIDVPWDQALDVILKTNGLDKVLEGNVMRIAPIEKLRREREALKQAKIAEEDLEPVVVKFVRISYAKASDMRPLVETVLTERGTVAYDERTNQLIIKDIRRGAVDALRLIEKLDLRTPQVLLETQIVEAQRSLLRDLGSELGFSFVRSPEIGNATGYNFPNSIAIGGAVDPTSPGIGASFPAAATLESGSAISFLLDSADGSRSLDYRLSALESEGRVRIVSKPSVATTNNQQAVIKSVEKIRIKTPSGGSVVQVGSNPSGSGSGAVATETIEIGIVLEVTPQASPDYYVLLDINAKSSTLGSTVVEGIPSEVERSATSTVLVSSDQTFAMGGIYKITDRDSVDGVPFLKDIPFIGTFFRRSLVNNSDEELIFFITPRIVEGSFDDAAMKMGS